MVVLYTHHCHLYYNIHIIYIHYAYSSYFFFFYFMIDHFNCYTVFCHTRNNLYGTFFSLRHVTRDTKRDLYQNLFSATAILLPVLIALTHNRWNWHFITWYFNWKRLFFIAFQLKMVKFETFNRNEVVETRMRANFVFFEKSPLLSRLRWFLIPNALRRVIFSSLC